MDRASKYLIWGFVLIFIAVAYHGYRVFFVERDFIINGTTECDPAFESCFAWCEEECEEDYYKKITKKSSNIAVCNELFEECESLVCEPGERGCKIIYCSEETVEESEICTNPTDFQNIENEIEPVGTETVI